jgi:hypothetical protein
MKKKKRRSKAKSEVIEVVKVSKKQLNSLKRIVSIIDDLKMMGHL